MDSLPPVCEADWGHVKNTRAAEHIVHIRWPCDLHVSEIT